MYMLVIVSFFCCCFETIIFGLLVSKILRLRASSKMLNGSMKSRYLLNKILFSLFFVLVNEYMDIINILINMRS